MPSGTFIVFEGADGVGKSTQVRLLADAVRAQGLTVAAFSFPRYGTTTGDVIRDLLHRSESVWRGLHWRTRALLYAMDRQEALPEIESALAECDVVLSDRYVESNAAYLSSEAAAPEEAQERAAWIYRLEYDFLNLPRPDLTVLLELSPHLAQQLLRAERADRDVNETLAYQERLGDAFLLLVGGSQTPKVKIAVGHEAEGIRSPEEVHRAVQGALVGARVLPAVGVEARAARE